MNSVIIFDVSPSNAIGIVKESMRAKGYYFAWGVTDKPTVTYNLPHNIVWKPDTETNQALSDLNQSIAQINLSTAQQIVQLRCVVLNSTPWLGIIGTPVI